MTIRQEEHLYRLPDSYTSYNIITNKHVCGISIYLKVSSIIVNNTNFPSNGTTNDVGGIISASSKKNTVNESRMDMLNDTCAFKLKVIYLFISYIENINIYYVYIYICMHIYRFFFINFYYFQIVCIQRVYIRYIQAN